jgi:hypothetical protein
VTPNATIINIGGNTVPSTSLVNTTSITSSSSSTTTIPTNSVQSLFCQRPQSSACVPDGILICGIDINGKTSNYSDYCVACAIATIVSYTRTPCVSNSTFPSINTTPSFTTSSILTSTPQGTSTVPVIIQCSVTSRSLCLPDNIPVCGRSSTNRYTNFPNACAACSDQSVVEYTRALCPNFQNITSNITTSTTSVTSTNIATVANNTNGQLPSTLPGVPSFAPTPITSSSSTVQPAIVPTATPISSSAINSQTTTVPINPLLINSQTTTTSTNSSPINSQPIIVKASTSLPVFSCTPLRNGCNPNMVEVCAMNTNGLNTTYSNACNACAVPNVIQYTKASCGNTPNTVSTTTINTVSSTVAITPTLPGGVNNNGTLSGIPISQSTTTSQSITPSIAIQPVLSCTPQFRSLCVADGVPTCGLWNTGQIVDYPNSCVACAEPSVISFTRMQCSNAKSILQPSQLSAQSVSSTSALLSTPSIPSTLSLPSTSSTLNLPTFCQPSQRSLATCASDNTAACGYSSSGAPRTFAGVCSACVDSTVLAYTKGVCQNIASQTTTKITTTNAAAPATTNCLMSRSNIAYCTLAQNPVCGNLINGINRSYLNPCLACADVNIAGYSVGACPGTNINVNSIIMGN